MASSVYERPREKLARKGVSALSNAELLQVIIGSGNAQTSVSKIAKKVALVLATSGSSVHPQELLAIPGVGMVRAGQILALFELATRFPTQPKKRMYDSRSSYEEIYKSLSKVSKQTLLYATFDGGKRLIASRKLIIDKSASFSKQVQKVFADCLMDSAASMFVAIGSSKQVLEPNLEELSLIRNIYKTSNLLSIPVKQIILVSRSDERVLKEMSA